MSRSLVSIIVPALNEAENIPLLVPRIAGAMGGQAYEILIVDDGSPDNTRQICQELARHYPLRLLVRQRPQNGLSGAVLHGLAHAQGDCLVVMDADLQHPPEKIPELLSVLRNQEGDFALGSRHVAGGSTDGRWGLVRQMNSWVATWLARPFAGPVKDPMSGFFALTRATYQQAESLTPLGYKIALELICKCRVRQVREVPIHFGLRQRGQSKLNFQQRFRYLEHLSRLYDFTFPRRSAMAKFLIVLAASWLLAAAAYGLLMHWGGFWPSAAAPLAYAAALLVTAVFHVRYVHTQREYLLGKRPWADFVAIGAAEWLTCGLVSYWVSQRVIGATRWDAFVIPFGCATVVRYVLRKELLQDLRGLRRNLPRERENGTSSGEGEAQETQRRRDEETKRRSEGKKRRRRGDGDSRGSARS